MNKAGKACMDIFFRDLFSSSLFFCFPQVTETTDVFKTNIFVLIKVNKIPLGHMSSKHFSECGKIRNRKTLSKHIFHTLHKIKEKSEDWKCLAAH